jgi:hypothetical protein
MEKITFQNKKYILSISFANYLKGISGMAKVLLEHQKVYNAANISYVNLFVVKKYLLHEKITAFCVYGLVIDGTYKGIFQMEQIIDLIKSWKINGSVLLDIHLHHFLFIKIKQVYLLFNSLPKTPIKIYLHDYYTMCCNFTLMKNGIDYCGDGALSDIKCGNCSYYLRSKVRIREISALIHQYKNRITIVSPSETTKAIWLSAYSEFIGQVVVIPHQKHEAQYTGNRGQITVEEKVRIAYLGMPAMHKGWNDWQEVVQKADINRFEFYVFNSSNDLYNGMIKVKVQYSAESLSAMTQALREYKIHVVLLWAKWPETYSYTYYESLSANAYVITNSVSGNITDKVMMNRNGIVLRDKESLFELFKEDEIKHLVNTFRASKVYGPDQLLMNRDIVNAVFYNDENVDQSISWSQRPRIYNWPLLLLLRLLYKMGKIMG